MRRLLHICTGLMLLAWLAAPGQAPVTAQGSQRLYLPLLAAPGAGPTLTASYLGGPGADEVRAADIDANERLLLAGQWPDGPIGGVTPAALPGGDGAVVRLAANGQAVATAARVGRSVRDMEASPAGPVIVCGDFGIAALSPTLDSVLWRDTPGDVQRCAAGANGGAVALVAATVYTYGPGGSGRTSWAVPGTRAADLALDASGALVFVTGYTQKTSTLKVAYLRAYGLDGATRWTAYDFAADALVGASLTADSEGRRVAMGADGKLYVAGWTDGGNSLYGRDPRDLTRRLAAAELVKFDAYNDPFNLSGAKSLAWYGRFEPGTGQLLLGQWLLTRLSDGKGNSISVQAIDAGADGTVALAGDTAYAIAGREGQTFAGVTLGGYESGEPYLLVVQADFKRRRLWTALAAPGISAGGSPASGVAVGRGVVALGATLNPRSTGTARGLVTTRGAPQPAPAATTTSEGYYLLMEIR